MFQLFGGPVTSPVFANRPPTRVLELGCGSGFWSMMCHRYFAQHGHTSISFTGVDVAPMAGSGSDPNLAPDRDMNWRFVQHDLRHAPWPFATDEFDLIMLKDMSFASDNEYNAALSEEFTRVLMPGGVVEVWESDHVFRMLRPHAPKNVTTAHQDDHDSSSDEEDEISRLGAYALSGNTPLSAPLNTFLVEYNGWINKAMESRGLSSMPCTYIQFWLSQEADALTDIRSKRLAVPFSEIRWEREGVGGVVTKGGKSYIDSSAMKGKGKASDAKGTGGKILTPTQAAVRRTALETSVALIQSCELILRDISGKSQDEWDNWSGKMMNDLLREGGTSWGECLEMGAWSATKRTKRK
jgi:SAM-dependent methyltransferase